MTFSAQVKQEIINKTIDNDCCKLARIAGLVKAFGSLNIGRGHISFSCESESEDALKQLLDLIKQYFGATLDELVIKTSMKGQYAQSEVEIPFEIGERILFEIGAISRKCGNIQIEDGICGQILQEECCKKSYLAGLFLGCGTISNPQTNRAGYHLELSLDSELVAREVMQFFAEFNLLSRMIERKGKFVVYFKEGDTIFDCLVLLGATSCAFSLQNEKIKKDIKNNINRQANCKTANAEKAVNSAVKEIVAITKVAEQMGLDRLDRRLRVVAEARLNFPELSLNDLLLKIDEPLTKSGLRYRMAKLIEIADELNG